MKKIIFGLIMLLAAVPAYGYTKIDPFLMNIYNVVNEMSRSQSLSAFSAILSPDAVIQSQSGNIMTDVLIKTTLPDGIKRFIVNNGGSTGTSINGIITAQIPLSILYKLAQRQDVIDITLSKRLHTWLDKSVPAVGGNLVHNGDYGLLPRPYMGRDVIIGIVDSGLDLTHADLHYSDGSTKVISLWDQTLVCNSSNCAPPTGFGYGVECTGYRINTGQCKEQDTVGHGTHVAGIADSSNDTYMGMAPDAMLVIVKTDMTESHVLDGINYIFSLASKYDKPAVVNLSLGAQFGPHDGSTSMEQAMDDLVTQSRARAIVVAAGNDGGNPIHLGFTANAGSYYASYFSVITNKENPGQSVIDLWYNTTSPKLSFSLGVIDLNGNILTQTGWVAPGKTLAAISLVDTGGTDYGQASIDASAIAWGGSKRNEVILSVTSNGSSLDLTKSMYSYRYAVFIKNNDLLNIQPLNAWIETDNSLFDTITPITISGYNIVKGDTSDTVSFPATARYVVAVGSFVTKSKWISKDGNTYGFSDTSSLGDLSFFSSRGPTPDPTATGQKPNISAPGEIIVSSLSTQASFSPTLITQDGTHVALRGTSMAAPHVTGAIALLFDRNNGLSVTETIDQLENTATADLHTGILPNNDWGYGKLNALALVQSVTPTFMDKTPPVISNVIVPSIGATTQIEWATNELSSSYVIYWNTANTAQTFSAGTTTMTEAHIVNIINLNSDSDYSYQVVSADPMGNTSKYPANGSLKFSTPKNNSSGCTCEQSGNRFNAGDLMPYILLLLGWFGILKLTKRSA